MNMKFIRNTQNIPYQTNENITQTTQIVPNMINYRRRGLSIPKVSNDIPNIPEPIKPEQTKMVWGEPIWYLFHTLAEKVKVDAFTSIRSELLNNIFAISTHLPCPICSDHAKEYLGKINFNIITKKDDLKNMLFEFHNVVNKRKGYPIFSKSELDEKYSKANTINIIKNFMIHFKDKHRSPKLMADDLQRSRIASTLKDWFERNIIYFD